MIYLVLNSESFYSPYKLFAITETLENAEDINIHSLDNRGIIHKMETNLNDENLYAQIKEYLENNPTIIEYWEKGEYITETIYYDGTREKIIKARR